MLSIVYKLKLSQTRLYFAAVALTIVFLIVVQFRLNNGTSNIPPIIHYIYIGSNSWSIDTFYERHIRGCMQMNPDVTFILWTEINANKFLQNNGFNEERKDLLNPMKRMLVSRTDVLRYFILWKFGGIYMDLDTICQRPVYDFLKNKSCALGQEPPLQTQIIHKVPYTPMTNFMAAIPNHSFLKQLVMNLKPAESINEEPVHATGPIFLKNQYESYINSFFKWNHVELLDYHLFHPNIDWKTYYDKCNPPKSVEAEKACPQFSSYFHWYNTIGQKNAILLHDWSHRVYSNKTRKVFNPFFRFPRLKKWPSSSFSKLN